MHINAILGLMLTLIAGLVGAVVGWLLKTASDLLAEGSSPFEWCIGRL